MGLGSARNSTTTHLVRSRNPNLPVSSPVLVHSGEGVGGCKVQAGELKAALAGLLLRGRR